jgi:hypothetical protein
MMRVLLIHGGVWDGWWVMDDEQGRRRIVRDLLDCEFVGIAATTQLEDVTPTELKAPPVRSHRRKVRPPWLRISD